MARRELELRRLGRISWPLASLGAHRFGQNLRKDGQDTQRHHHFPYRNDRLGHFRIENLPDAFTFISRLFAFDFQSIVLISSPHFYVTLVLAIVLAFIVLSPLGKKMQNWVYYTDFSNNQHIAVWSASILLFIFCLSAISATGFSPFIYFKF